MLLIIRRLSISMRARSATLRFDWSRTGLGMDVPVFCIFPYEDWLRISFKTGKMMFRPAFQMVTDISTSDHPDRALVLFGLSLSRSFDSQGVKFY